jgi:GNAT superfamily N-acetyltransferase
MTRRPAAIPIRPAHADELVLLQAIEVAAGTLFVHVGMSYISDHDPPSLDRLEGYRQAGRAWVATTGDDRPVAYLIADVLDGNAHIEQVSVHPDFGRQGIGRSLIDGAETWAVDRGLRAVTLTTFADVPWNRPYYARCGFITMEEADMGPELARRWIEETGHGLSRHPRVAMIRPATWQPRSGTTR